MPSCMHAWTAFIVCAMYMVAWEDTDDWRYQREAVHALGATTRNTARTAIVIHDGEGALIKPVQRQQWEDRGFKCTKGRVGGLDADNIKKRSPCSTHMDLRLASR